MEHLSNALKAVFKEQDGDEVLFCANMMQKDNQYNRGEMPRPDTEMKESQIQYLVTTQVGLSYSPMHNFPRCNQRE